jgi:hypothetical protein
VINTNIVLAVNDAPAAVAYRRTVHMGTLTKKTQRKPALFSHSRFAIDAVVPGLTTSISHVALAAEPLAAERVLLVRSWQA